MSRQRPTQPNAARSSPMVTITLPSTIIGRLDAHLDVTKQRRSAYIAKLLDAALPPGAPMTKVNIEVQESGTGHVGVIRDVRSGREIARTIVRRHDDEAHRDAKASAEAEGWSVVG